MLRKITTTLGVSFALLAMQTQAQDAPAAKMNAYIECYNGVIERGYDSIERYQSWVADMDAGPTGNENLIYGLYDLHDHAIDNCKENVPAAIALEPSIPDLDAAAQQFLDALIPFSEQVSEANKYYDRENYKDDDFEKGKAMHPKLVASMNAFMEGSDALSAALDAQSGGADEARAQLAEIEATMGKGFEYHLMAMMIEAGVAVELLSEETFDIDAAKAAVSVYEDNADAYMDYTKENDDNLPISAAFLELPVENFRVAIKERFRRVRDNVPYSQGEQNNLSSPGSGWMVEGSTFKVVKAYNDLIDAANK